MFSSKAWVGRVAAMACLCLFSLGDVGRAATQIFTGATSAANTNAAGNGTFNYGPPYGYAGAVTTYLIDAAGTNLSGAYTGGVDELLFDGSATGSTFSIAVDSTITSVANPAAIRFSDSGGAGKTYIFQRASTTAGGGITLGFTGGTAGATADSYNSGQILGATLPASGSTSLVLETGFTGKVILRSVANNTAAGTTTINGGTLEINNAGALPTNGTNANNPGTVTLNGGKLVININVGNEETGEGSRNPASGQFNGTLNVTANSILSNGAINFDGSPRRQDLWGAAAGGSVTIGGGVTLNVDTGGGSTIRNAVTGVVGGNSTVNLGTSGNYLRLSTVTGAGAGNVHFNLGSGSASLDLASGTSNIGHLTGGNNTAVRGNSGAASTIQIGAMGLGSNYGGQILNGFGSNAGGGPATPAGTVAHSSVTKTGAGTYTLSGENRYSGTTTVNGGTLRAGSTSAFGDSASVITASTGGTLDLNGQSQEVGKAFVLSGGSLVNDAGVPVTLSTGAAGHANNNASGAIFGAGTDTGAPSTTGSWTMNGGTVPAVAISGGGGTGAAAVAKMQIGWLRMNAAAAGGALGAAGSGYTKAPVLTFAPPSDPNGRTAKAYVTIGPPGGATAGLVTGIQIVDPGWGYTSVPDLTIDNTGTGGTGFRPIFAMQVDEFEFTSAGSGYTSAPTIAVTNLGTVSGTTNAGVVPVAPTTTGGFGSVALNAATTSNIGGAGDLNVNSPVSGSGNLVKIGAGTVVLGSTNTYSGTTQVSQGTLKVNGSANSSTFTVNSGATLGGSGSVGPVTVDSNGTLAPGSSIESLDVVGALTLNGTLQVEYADNLAPAIDVVNVSGLLDLSSTSDVVDFQQVGTALTGSAYVFASYGSLNGTFNSVLNLPTNYAIDYNYQASNMIALVVAAVPEVSSFLAVGLAGAAGLALRVAKRRRQPGAADVT